MTTENLKIYNTLKGVPENARRTFSSATLKNFTDINPMWRIKMLTDMFGMCGVGWKYEITKQWSETGAAGEVSAFCNINLYVKVAGEWSAAIPGTGGSRMINTYARGLVTSDECYKMALTDAISVACKALGMGAEVYWEQDSTKYESEKQERQTPANAFAQPEMATSDFPSGLEILDACDALSKVTNRTELLAVNKRYGGMFGEQGKEPNMNYIDLLMAKCHQFPKK